MSNLRINQLREARKRPQTLLLGYLTLRSKNHNSLICIFEGNDDVQFYQAFFSKNERNIDFIPFTCNGKDNVLELRKLLTDNCEEKENNYLTAYFIDKDFDDYKGYQPSNNIYCTPTYSIENILVSEHILKNLMQGEFHCNDEDGTEDTQAILTLYRERLKEFTTIFKEINLLIYHARINTITLTNIEDDIRKYVKINIDKIEQKYDSNAALSLLGYSIIPDSKKLSETKKAFEKLDPLNDWRGKFLFSFFIKFLSDLKEDRCNKTPSYFKKSKKVNFNPHNDIIRILASIAKTPACLNKFISHLASICNH